MLPKATRQEIGADILRVQYRWPVSKPLVGSFGKGLYEIRTPIRGTIYRVLFCIVGSEIVLLHGFQKKTQKTPRADLELARIRQNEVRQ